MRKLLSFCAALICAATMYAENMALYFVPNSDWATTGGAKYAAWYFDGSGADGFSAFMTLVPGETNLYTTEIPTGYASVIIARINGAAAEPNWSDKWNQTANLTIPAGKNCFTQAAGWDDMSGTWSTYVAWSEIAFTEAIAAGNFDNKVFAVADSSFKFVCSDATNKMSIDANNATFGTAAGNTKYSYRLKSGGKSGATNYMTFTIPANGTFRFAARPAGTGDRSVVLTQGENELFNQVITDTKNDDNYYDYKSVAVAAGSLTVTYSNGMNFYSFAFVANDNEPETPAVVTKDLKFVPGVWKEANAVLAAWTWGAQAAGAWSTFAGSGDTLIAKINEKADSVIFVRFEAGAAIDWNSTVWNRKEDAINACGVFIVNAWDNYSWCTVPAPEVPCEGKFGIMLNDSLYIPARHNEAQQEWLEYAIDSIELKVGDKFQLHDSCSGGSWIVAPAYDAAAYAFDTVANHYVVKMAGAYALYIKLIPNADELYVINKTYVAPEPCEGKFGFMVDSLYVPAIRNAAQEQWVEYFIDSLDLKAGQKLCLFDSCAQAGWISAVAYADEAYAFEIDTVAHKWVVKEAGTYALYIKMIPNADELYVINKSHVAPEPCEGKFGFMVDSLYVPALRNAAQEQWVEYAIDSIDLKVGQKLNLFDSCAQAGWISAVAYADEAYAFEIDTVAKKWVVKEAGTYALYIKMIPNADELYVINKSHVAPEPCEGKFGFMVDSLYVPALRNAAQEQWVEYAIDSIDLKVGQKLNLFDSCAQAGWISAVAYADEAYAFEIDTVAKKWVVKEAGTYALYIKMIPNADELYVINKSHVAPEPCEGKFGIMLNDSLYIPARHNEAQQEWLEYAIDSIELKVGDKFQLHDSCSGGSWIVAPAYGADAYAFDTVANHYVVKMAGAYALYIKLIPNADELYVINKTYVAPQPCEGKFGFMVDSLYVPALRNAAQEQWVEYFIDSLDLKAGQTLNLFDSCAQAGWISAVAYADEAYAFEIDTVAHKWVVKEAGTYALYIKMIPNADELYVINKSHVAPEPCEGKFGFMVDSLYVPALRNAAQEQWVEYFIDSLDLRAGQKLNLFDSCAQAGWISAVAYADEAYAFEIDTVAHKWVVKEAGTYALYIKMIPNADELYVINKSHVAPEPCEGKFGIMLNDSLYIPARHNEAQQEWLEYAIDSIELKVGDKFQLHDSCSGGSWIVAPAYGADAYAFDTVANHYVVKMAGAYALYIKLIPNADELYVINKTYVAPQPCEGKFGFMVDSLYVPALRNAAQEQWVEYFIDSLDLKAGQKLNLFDSCAQAGWISAVAYADEAYAFEIDTVAHKWVVKEAGTYALYIKMIPNADELYVINKSHVAPEPCEGKFGIMLNGQYVAAARNEMQTEYLEYMILGIDLAAGQHFQIYDSCNAAGWIIATPGYGNNAYAFNVDAQAQMYEVTMAGSYDLYIKMIQGADELYVINKDYVEPEPCEGKFGIMLNGQYIAATLNTEAAVVEYMILGQPLTAGQHFQLYDSCNAAGWIMTPAYQNDAYAFRIDTENQMYEVTMDGNYDLYVKLVMGADELYVINQSYNPEPPTPCEGEFGIMVNGTKFVAGEKNEGQTAYLEYTIQSNLYENETLVIYDNCNQAGFLATQEEGGYWFTLNAAQDAFIVPQDGAYTIYLKMYGPGNNVIYTVNNSGSGLEETLYNDGKLHKVVEDGIIVIYRDGKRYNLQGQALR